MTLTLPAEAQTHRSIEDLSPFSVIHKGIRPSHAEPDFTLRQKGALSPPASLPFLLQMQVPVRPCITSWMLQE